MDALSTKSPECNLFRERERPIAGTELRKRLLQKLVLVRCQPERKLLPSGVKLLLAIALCSLFAC